MNINLEILMYIAGSRSLHNGRFEVNVVDFKKDSDWAAAVTAYQFIQRIKSETGYRNDTKILKVKYNGENDITDLVKKVRLVIHDDLPF